MTLTLDQGCTIISIARTTLDSFAKTARVDPDSKPGEAFLKEKMGVFVTLNKVEGGVRKLRGCVGFPYPVRELGTAVVTATIAAASEDPRFQPVRPEELELILVEVSALTLPLEIKAAKVQDLSSQIEVGKDGLIVSDGTLSGVLLPQVATEFSFSPSDFLSEACMKAGLLPDSWLSDGVTVKKFRAEVFAEERPHGPVRRLTF